MAAEVGDLAGYFAGVTGLAAPQPVSDRALRERRVLWIEPLREIGRPAGSAAVGEALIREAVEKLRGKGCIIKAPSSILGTARAMAAEVRRRDDRSRFVTGPYSDRVRH